MRYTSGCGRTRALGHFSTNGLCADGGQYASVPNIYFQYKFPHSSDLTRNGFTWLLILHISINIPSFIHLAIDFVSFRNTSNMYDSNGGIMCLSKVKSGSGRKIAHKCLVALVDGYSNAINVPKHFPY